MKTLLTLTLLLASVFMFAQTDNPIKLTHETDEFTGKSYLSANSLLITDDGVTGFRISPYLEQSGDKWVYSALSGKSTVGSCFEKDKIYIIFEDNTKLEMTSWMSFNCKGSIGFDLNGKLRKELSKPIKAIKFQNGRDYTSFSKTITNEEDKYYFINFFKALDDYNATH